MLNEEPTSLFSDNQWNNTEAEYAKNKCICDLFELQVHSTPDAVAVVWGNEQWTYSELNARANQLARYLQKKGVRPDMPVGLFINRSVHMVIGLLAILKAGGAYVPYDSAYPKERLFTMFQEMQIEILLTLESLEHRLPEHESRVVYFDKDWEEFAREDTKNITRNNTTSENLAYVVFTSGSTGKPKATAVLNRGWNNLLSWFIKKFQIGSKDKVLVVSSFSFDITQRSIMMPLVSGGELHLLASDYFDSELILNTIEMSQITLINCAPSPFYALTESKDCQTLARLKSLRTVFLGGEAIAASRLLNCISCESFTAEFVNVYGVAECSDVSTFYQLQDFEEYASSSVPIGKPIFNTNVYVVDDNLTSVSLGVVGELCIAGHGVGKGYLNDRTLTEEKFVLNPFSSETEARLYKTGDLVLQRSDGNLEFVGRLDHQIKIRGMRIELGEIETLLRQHENVRESVLTLDPFSNSQQLIAYIVPKNTHEYENEQTDRIVCNLRQYLANYIPQYMIPNKFVLLENMPLNPNGKIDRKCLQNTQTPAGESNIERSRNSIEIAIGAFFAEALNVSRVSLDEDFFELGGHSLLALQVISRIKEAFGVNLGLSVFSSERTSAVDLAKYVEKARKQQ